MRACRWPSETWESSLWLWCATLGRISCRTVPVSFFLTTTPDRGETAIVNIVKAYDEISSIICFYVFQHVSHVIWHLSDGMSYLVVDGANQLRQGHVWWCPRVLNPSSWDILSTCASTFSTDASSESRATVGTAECHRAKIGNSRWCQAGRLEWHQQPPESYLDFLQHTLQSSPRRQTRSNLTTGFSWLNPSLDCFTALSSRRPYS
jgi:hypothetical protein